MNKTRTWILGAGLLAAGLLAGASAEASNFTLNFSSPGGTVLDTNGVGSGFTARMPGTGAAITGNDTNLLLNTTAGVLAMHDSPGADFNGQVAMDAASVPGVNLSSLGYTGANDFTATATFVNLPTTPPALQPDQLCLIVGINSTASVRAGFINFSAFHAAGTDANEGFGTLNSGGTDVDDRFFGTVVGTNMTVVISRIGGNWTVTVNGIDRLPNANADGTGAAAPPTFLDGASDLFVGVVAQDVGNDSPWVANLKSFTVNVVEGATKPAIDTQPAKQLVNEGNPVTFSAVVTADTAQPRSYQWLHNGVPVAGQTGSSLTFNPSAADAGGYSVIITNSLGGITSSVAPLEIILPVGALSLDFSAAAGGIHDSNGIGTGFPTRLPGTGFDLLNNDTNLFLDSTNGQLDMTTTSSDYNGGNAMDVNENLGVSLATLGFTGTQDLNVTALFDQPFPATVSFDQFGVYVGRDTNYLTRAGSITFANKERFSENVQPDTNGFPANGNGQYFGFAFDSTIPMTALISRTAGIWHYYIDGVPWDVFVQPTNLNVLTNVTSGPNIVTNLTAGVFTEDVANGVHKTFLLDSFKARVFPGPKLKLAATNGNLTFTWNVAGAGLQSSTNLTTGAGFAPIPAATNSPYVIPIPTHGQNFYRIGL